MDATIKANMDSPDCGTMETVAVGGRNAKVYMIPLGPATLVLAVTDTGVLGCGAIDPGPLEGFGIPAARARPTRGPSIANAAGLLAGEVREANTLAQARGVVPGISGADALQRL